MIDKQRLLTALSVLDAVHWFNRLEQQIDLAFSDENHGDLNRWKQVLNELPQLEGFGSDLITQVRIGEEHDLSPTKQLHIQNTLKKLHPWRKGPYQLFGIELDTEWRSDWKWDRLKQHISPLYNRRVLDVGCGNGYHCWRMLGAGARLVIGIDPTLLNVFQFQAIQKLYGKVEIHILPIGIEDMPLEMKLFDTVFSMGVLYHRRSPIDHLMELKGCLKPGGELVLETLVIEGDKYQVLVPEQRYAKMRNVWFLPSCAALRIWLERCGFKNIKLIDVTKTTTQEQRSTEWMQFHSLKDFLDPNHSDLTCEGFPAPTRAIFIAQVE